MMKRVFVILIFMSCLSISMVCEAQISMGMRDSHFAYVDYTYREHYMAKFEGSVYYEKLPCQYFRLYAGYKTATDCYSLCIAPYYGRTYNTIYWDLGAVVEGYYQIKRFGLMGKLNPTYDSTLGYKTCFLAGAFVNVYGPMSVVVDFTTVPEYRMSENRLQSGLAFKFEKFWFNPMLTMPVSGPGSIKQLRVNFSFNYQF